MRVRVQYAGTEVCTQRGSIKYIRLVACRDCAEDWSYRGRAGSNFEQRNADAEVERAALSQRDFVISTYFSNDFSYYPPCDGALWERSQR